jgi:hypothetical protein
MDMIECDCGCGRVLFRRLRGRTFDRIANCATSENAQRDLAARDAEVRVLKARIRSLESMIEAEERAIFEFAMSGERPTSWARILGGEETGAG